MVLECLSRTTKARGRSSLGRARERESERETKRKEGNISMQVKEQQPDTAKKKKKKKKGKKETESERKREGRYYLGLYWRMKREQQTDDRSRMVLRSVVDQTFRVEGSTRRRRIGRRRKRIGCCMLPSAHRPSPRQGPSQPATGEIGYYRRRAVSAFLVTG